MRGRLPLFVTILLVLILLFTFVLGCKKATPTPAPTVTPTVAPTATVAPTVTVATTATGAPTKTATPTATAPPTVTATATAPPTAMPTVSKPTVVLKYADPGPPTASRNKSAEETMKLIETLTGGRIKHELYWNESLAKAKDIFKAIQDGTADCGDATVIVYQPDRCPISQFIQLLFVVPGDIFAATSAMNEMYATTPEVKKELDGLGIKLLSFTSLTPTVMVSKKELRTADDFKGIRMRAVGPPADWVTSLGATPSPISYYEVAEALSRGLLDGAQTYVYAFYGYKWYEYLKYLCTDGIAHIAVDYWINLDTFNKMPADLQKIYVDTWWNEYPKIVTRVTNEEYDTQMAEMQKTGLKLYSLTPEQLARWKAVAEPVNEKWYKQMESKGIDSKKLVAKYQDLYNKYAKK